MALALCRGRFRLPLHIRLGPEQDGLRQAKAQHQCDKQPTMEQIEDAIGGEMQPAHQVRIRQQGQEQKRDGEPPKRRVVGAVA